MPTIERASQAEDKERGLKISEDGPSFRAPMSAPYVVAAKQNAARFGYSVSPNRELVALGAGNLIGSFIPGTLPAYGSITRSAIQRSTFQSVLTREPQFTH